VQRIGIAEAEGGAPPFGVVVAGDDQQRRDRGEAVEQRARVRELRRARALREVAGDHDRVERRVRIRALHRERLRRGDVRLDEGAAEVDVRDVEEADGAGARHTVSGAARSPRR
jgi:hypothetical protein